jgi:hypothetical protein
LACFSISSSSDIDGEEFPYAGQLQNETILRLEYFSIRK